MENVKFTLLIVVSLLLLRGFRCDGIVRLKLDMYSNEEGKGDNDNCCDGVGIFCSGKCDHYFVICLDTLDSPNNDDMSICPYGEMTTEITHERNTINFGTTIGESMPNPIEFTFEGPWEGGARIKVDIWDNDSSNLNENDFVDFLSTTVQTEPGMPAIPFPIQDRTVLHVSLAVECSGYWMGPRCYTYCVPGANHRCDRASGHKICNPGWSGDNCDVDIDECASSPCNLDAGTCMDALNAFFCECEKGHAGDLCEREAVSCDEAPCHENGVCIPEDSAFSCECAEGYKGRLCGEQSMPCDQEPCQNGATCSNRANSAYLCICSPGWTGDTCSEEIDECESSPCGTNGLCIDGIDGYKCNCQEGWAGNDCEEPVDDCIDNHQCAEGASCIDGHMSYTCVCPEGLEGQYCTERPLVQPAVRPVILLTQEVVRPTPAGKLCRAGRVRCMNGAQCKVTATGPECSCANGYMGDDCAVYEKCVNFPCMNNGTCAEHPREDDWCSCPETTSGDQCETCQIIATSKAIVSEPNAAEDDLSDDDYYDVYYNTDAIAGDVSYDVTPEIEWDVTECPNETSSQCSDAGGVQVRTTLGDLRCVFPKDFKGRSIDLAISPIKVEQTELLSLNFKSDVSPKELSVFHFNMHNAAAATLGIPPRNISDHHEHYTCEEVDETGSTIKYTALVYYFIVNDIPANTDIRRIASHLNDYASQNMMDFQITELDKENCYQHPEYNETPNPKMGASNNKDVSHVNKISLYCVVAVSMCVIGAVILGIAYLKYRREEGYVITSKERKRIVANRQSMRRSLYDPRASVRSHHSRAGANRESVRSQGQHPASQGNQPDVDDCIIIAASPTTYVAKDDTPVV